MNLFRAACLGGALAAFLSSVPVHAAQEPVDVIRKFDGSLLDVMKNANDLGLSGRFQKLDQPIRQTFNIPFMTRIVVGPDWNSWTKEQQDTVSAAFGKLIISTYAMRFDGYGGESFIEDGMKPLSTGTVVLTRLVRPNDEAVALNYVMRQNPSGQWQVVDVFLTGSISELATRRSEFSAVLQRQGYEGLLKELDAKSKVASQ